MHHDEEEQENFRKVERECWSKVISCIRFNAQIHTFEKLIDICSCLLTQNNVPQVKLYREIEDYQEDLTNPKSAAMPIWTLNT